MEIATLNLKRLKWVTIVSPLLFLFTLEVIRAVVFPEELHLWPGYLLWGGVVLTGALFFSEIIFGVIGRMQNEIETRNRELLALHEASLGITSSLALDVVLQRVVDQARSLVDARYAALSILDNNGHILEFLTSGLTAEERSHIGPPPQGRGLLGVAVATGRPLIVNDISKDPRSIGFPPNHPPMKNLLIAPIIVGDRRLGNLYVTDNQIAGSFGQNDIDVITRFATQSAIAIENAHLLRSVRELAVSSERERIAREMHDSLAQVLGYVNTKSQAIDELLKRGVVEQAREQLRQLSEAARSAYADVREDILALRTSLPGDQSLESAIRQYLDQYRQLSGINAEFNDSLDERAAQATLEPMAELQLLRIIQEALSNVRKHAGVDQAKLSVAIAGDQLLVTVEEKGRGFDPENLKPGEFPRFGLSTMRERAEAVGGKLELYSAPGQGTKLVVKLPLAAGQLVNKGE